MGEGNSIAYGMRGIYDVRRPCYRYTGLLDYFLDLPEILPPA